jgi:hypothetical protein
VPLITDYTSLQATAIEYLARDQDTTLIARVPTFVQSFEAKMNRALFVRQMETRVSTQTDPTSNEPEYIALPADFQSLRRIRVTSVQGKPVLQFMSTGQMDDFRVQNADVPGQPSYWTIFGNELELAPSPDAAYTIEIIYRQNIPALASNSTNWLLTLAPDVYLYGALMESAPYIKEDPRIQTWGALFASALGDLNKLGEVSVFESAGTMAVRPDTISRW